MLADSANSETKLELKLFFEYLDGCRSTLDQVRKDILEYESNPAAATGLKKAAERLGEFCIEAESWRFDALYDLAQAIQIVLLNSPDRPPSEDFREAVDRGLNMLSSSLLQCVRDFRWRLAVADTLERLRQVSGS